MTPDDTTPDSTTPDGTTAGTAQGAGDAPVSESAARKLFRTALRDVLVFLAVLAVVGIGVGALVSGMAGVWGALLGVGVAVIFSGTTIWSMWRTSESSPSVFIGVVAGSWLAKIIVLFVLLLILKPLDFYDAKVFGVMVLVGVLGSVALDTLAVRRARVPYVDPS